MKSFRNKLTLIKKLQRLIKSTTNLNLAMEPIGALPHRLIEIAYYSRKVSLLINKIANRKEISGKNAVDSLLDDLVELQIIMFVELAYWAKLSKKPLQTLIDAVEKRLKKLDSIKNSN
jgi:hypothetical protein